MRWYNGENSAEYYVLAKEKYQLNGIYLEYVSEVYFKNEKNSVIWCQDVSMAQGFELGIHLSKKQKKIAIEKIIKNFGLFGKVKAYKVCSKDTVVHSI